MNELQELTDLQDATRILTEAARQVVEGTDAVWQKVHHARTYLNGIASRILNAADEF